LLHLVFYWMLNSKGTLKKRSLDLYMVKNSVLSFIVICLAEEVNLFLNKISDLWMYCLSYGSPVGFSI
jgi:hypothetical protein